MKYSGILALETGFYFKRTRNVTNTSFLRTSEKKAPKARHSKTGGVFPLPTTWKNIRKSTVKLPKIKEFYHFFFNQFKTFSMCRQTKTIQLFLTIIKTITSFTYFLERFTSVPFPLAVELMLQDFGAALPRKTGLLQA